MKRNNRRKTTAYLDYQDGQVVSMESLDDFEKQEAESMAECDSTGQVIKPKRVCTIASLILGTLICLLLVRNLYNGVTATSKIFWFLNSNCTSSATYNTEYLNNKKEVFLQSGSLHVLDFSGKREYKKSKTTAEQMMAEISKYDQYILSYYNSLKKSIHQYTTKKSSYYLMNSELKNLNKLVVYEYNQLASTTFTNEEVKMLFISRYQILMSFLSEHTNNFTAAGLLKDTNQLILEDNQFNLQEYEILKQYLNENGISYICEQNKIRIT